ncbi:MAG TPA: hypothetical protein VFY91_05665 [Microbacterium sp.]|nr:hypothetical protein [Microbacterium sp.]
MRRVGDADAREVDALVAGQGEHLADADVPLRGIDGELAEPEVVDHVDRRQLQRLVERARELDLRLRAAARERHGHEARPVRVIRLDDEMGDPAGAGETAVRRRWSRRP